jgi:UDP-N-acetylglucosamine/UDP-N-acetylgalactosamine diphosphorylase
MGYHVLAESEMTSQAVAKVDPLERVGNLMSVEGQVRIIEYSDLPADVAQQRNADGTLRFWAGSIAVHVFDVEFLQRMSHRAGALPFHLAEKIVPFIDEHGRLVEPDRPNAIKFERFVFDLMPYARNALVVEADRATAFAPVKNSNDAPTDTPKTAQQAMIAQCTDWLQKAGANVAPGVAVEIDPLWALDAREVAARIEPGIRIDVPKYFTD